MTFCICSDHDPEVCAFERITNILGHIKSKGQVRCPCPCHRTWAFQDELQAHRGGGA